MFGRRPLRLRTVVYAQQTHAHTLTQLQTRRSDGCCKLCTPQTIGAGVRARANECAAGFGRGSHHVVGTTLTVVMVHNAEAEHEHAVRCAAGPEKSPTAFVGPILYVCVRGNSGQLWNQY